MKFFVFFCSESINLHNTVVPITRFDSGTFIHIFWQPVICICISASRLLLNHNRNIHIGPTTPPALV